MFPHIGQVYLLSVSASPLSNAVPYEREDSERFYDYRREHTEPKSLYRRRPPQTLKTSHVLRRYTGASNSRVYPSPETETEPFYVHTLSRRVTSPSSDASHSTPLDRDDRYPNEDNDPTLENYTVRVNPEFERSDNWTPKQQDSIVSSWVSALSSLFSPARHNSTSSSRNPSPTATPTTPQYESKPLTDTWSSMDRAIRYGDVGGRSISRYDTVKDILDERGRPKHRDDQLLQDRAGRRIEGGHQYNSRKQTIRRRTYDTTPVPALRRRKAHHNDRYGNTVPRAYREQYIPPSPRQGSHMNKYSKVEGSDLDGNDLEPDFQGIDRHSTYHSASRGRRDNSQSRGMRYSRGGQELSRYGYEGSSEYRGRGGAAGPARHYQENQDATSDPDRYTDQDMRIKDTSSDEQRDEEGVRDMDNYESGGHDGNEEFSSRPNMPPLTRSETREMVQLFRRLFDTLDRSLNEPESEYQNRLRHDSLPDVRLALAEMEKINMQRELDRKAGVTDDSDVDLHGDVSSSVNDNSENEDLQHNTETDQDRDKETEISREIPADADVEESLRNIPPSSPAYGTRRKLLRQKNKGFFGNLYDSIMGNSS